jgi:hypothetical protein
VADQEGHEEHAEHDERQDGEEVRKTHVGQPEQL